MLIKTNRPPTDQERAIIQESIPPTNAKLRVVEAQISETMTHIQALKSQIHETEKKLRHLRNEEAAILETFANHRRIFSPFRNLPADVLREICVACVQVDMPTLSYRTTPLPYILAQISSTMRHIALTTPFLWASMNVSFSPHKRLDKWDYLVLASKAIGWFERAGSLSLTVFMQDPNPEFLLLKNVQSDPSTILFDTLFSYSNRWRRIEFESECASAIISAPIIRIAALTADDVPLLESITLRLKSGGSKFCNNTLLAGPKLTRLALDIYRDALPGYIGVTDFIQANWANLTSVTLGHCSINEVARVLRQTRRLVFCHIYADLRLENPMAEIKLPFLKTLRVDDQGPGPSSSGAHSVFDSISAPVLSTFKIHAVYLDISLAGFFKRSPDIQELALCRFRNDGEESLAVVAELLHYCPSLSTLNLRCLGSIVSRLPDANRFLLAFVEDGGAGVICPCLQEFKFVGGIKCSLQTLRQFLEVKQRGTAPMRALLPWKRVVIEMSWTDNSERYQMLELVSQKKAAGLDIIMYT
ncbi:hypothetical protein HYPSUDRAFT_208892 [Hypholoma sublateritium FD-334 SS-4]|uniref:F-box domain-containing protein n=1 Tax=Hypholoma sublateritium (strain FD-334 SS-4) TaxID=945553 RepID=A0A0D2KI36_HYPSF|nr:hypothetical protein HYPSUDRAFT_208892 [Hypholoma sublateritium FD-334 SS-4]